MSESEPGAGFQPVKEFRIYTRDLPHWEQPGNCYFITFKTAPGMTLSDEAKTIVFDAARFHAGRKYELYGAVVMESHVHLLLQPLEKAKDTYYSLAEIMHSIKSYSANRVQKSLGVGGSIWLDENMDRIIRSESDWSEKLNYVVYNPVKAGLVETPEEYRWLYFVGSG